MTIMPALWRLRQEDQEFDANLGYIEGPVLKKPRDVEIWFGVEGLPSMCKTQH
jgi:hypothetical protein